MLEAGGTPHLHELRLHNGTIYRWNRPVYDIADGRPAPAGGEPAARGRADRGRHDRQRRASTSAWSATLAESERPLWSQMSFSRRRGELPRGRPAWASTPRSTGPASARCRATELVLRRLLPMAHAGLDAWGVPSRGARPATSASSSSAACTEPAAPRGSSSGSASARGEDRYDALRATLLDYRDADAHQRAGPHLGLTARPGQRASGAAAASCRRTPAHRVEPAARVTTTSSAAAAGLARGPRGRASQPAGRRRAGSSSPGAGRATRRGRRRPVPEQAATHLGRAAPGPQRRVLGARRRGGRCRRVRRRAAMRVEPPPRSRASRQLARRSAPQRPAARSSARGAMRPQPADPPTRLVDARLHRLPKHGCVFGLRSPTTAPAAGRRWPRGGAPWAPSSSDTSPSPRVDAALAAGIERGEAARTAGWSS